MGFPGNAQCSCLPVSDCPGGGRLDLLLLVRTGRSTVVAASVAALLAPELDVMLGEFFLGGEISPRDALVAFAGREGSCKVAYMCSLWPINETQQDRGVRITSLSQLGEIRDETKACVSML